MEHKMSLYEINSNLQRIFNEIDCNDGEITPDIEEELSLTREQYFKKGESYADVINMYKGYLTQIKEEQDRLNHRKKVFENRIKRLEDALLNAISTFGPIETARYKIGTRKSTTYNLDEKRISDLSKYAFRFAREMNNNGVLILYNDIDLEGMLNAINANAKAEHEYDGNTEEFVPFTMSDLNCVKVDINTSSTISTLFNDAHAIKAILDNEMRFDVINKTSKTDVKNYSKISEDITIGSKVENELLSIK